MNLTPFGFTELSAGHEPMPDPPRHLISSFTEAWIQTKCSVIGGGPGRASSKKTMRGRESCEMFRTRI